MMQKTRSCEMEKLGELQREIEIVRKELDVVVADGIDAVFLFIVVLHF